MLDHLGLCIIPVTACSVFAGPQPVQGGHFSTRPPFHLAIENDAQMGNNLKMNVITGWRQRRQ